MLKHLTISLGSSGIQCSKQDHTETSFPCASTAVEQIDCTTRGTRTSTICSPIVSDISPRTTSRTSRFCFAVHCKIQSWLEITRSTTCGMSSGTVTFAVSNQPGACPEELVSWEIRSPWVDCSNKVSCSDHARVVCVVPFRPKAPAMGSCAAVRGQEGCWRAENGVSDHESASFDGSLCSEPRLLSDGHLVRRENC